ncbi:dihydrofolate reductase [Rhodocytophaga rosea]|uniref:Dihydrofolate reductase n=1 Tax=Rhodocytophaga rosea TaxID=2704465 RepID=A0A6C0GSD8_9BACT|nr:dihydrofolate reductase family protein [Rhodocytophaga rosea]QHT70999.1 dihydrofolate reductase [Rhodocytophaga rosea]
MRKIIYHVATTLDHYIAHENGTINGFLAEGTHVEDYLKSLEKYDTVLMGRRTYEFGYDYGLQKGQPAYPHMQHYIFSRSLTFDEASQQVHIIDRDEIAFINQLKQTEGTPIYLCGGGDFAGFLLEHQLIDELKIKLNPVLFGKGIPLFGNSKKEVDLLLLDTKVYESGVLLLTYQIKYHKSS